MEDKPARHIYQFGPFRLDPNEKTVFRNSEPVSLPPKTVDLLLIFVQSNGHLIEKSELLHALWPDSFVEESNLAHNIYMLRKVLSEGPAERQYIENIPRRGYRFTADVRRVPLNNGTDLEVEDQRFNTLPHEELVRTKRVSRNKQTSVTSFRRLNEGLNSQLGRTLLVVFVLCGLGFAGLMILKSANKADSSGPTKIAILPFTQIGDENNDELRGLGMADALITKLGRIQKVTVLPTSTVAKYAGRRNDPVAIGRELGVDTVLDGTIQSAGDRVRVTIRMITVGDGRAKWSDKFDERFTDIFGLQDTISEDVVQALSIQLSRDEKVYLTKHYTGSPEAYESYMMGLFFWNKRSKDGLAKAIQYFQKAIEKDPNYALAYAALADSYYLSDFYHYDILPKNEALEKSDAAAAKALAIDNTIAEAHTARAMVQLRSETDKVGAEKSLKHAITLNPNYATAHLRYAWLLMDDGRLDEAVEQMKDARDLEPTSLTTNFGLAAIYYFAHNYDDSIKYNQIGLEIDPNSPLGLFNIGLAYEQKGMYEEALSEFERLKGLQGGNELALEGIANVYSIVGPRNKVYSILRDLEKPVACRNKSSLNIAAIYAALNDNDSAFKWLKLAGDEQSLTTRLRFDPQLETLKSDPRFDELLRRYKLASLSSSSH